jgi:TRAP-type C4-dicarboxylate transport system permease small subunit
VRHLSSALDRTAGALFALAGLASVAMAGFYLWEVVARYALGAPTIWTSDAVGYALSVAIFAALPEVTRRRAHVAVDILPAALPGRGQVAITRATDAAAGLAAGAAGGIAAGEAWRQFERGLMTNAAVPVPRWPITAMIAAGLLLAAVMLLRDAGRGAR